MTPDTLVALGRRGGVAFDWCRVHPSPEGAVPDEEDDLVERLPTDLRAFIRGSSSYVSVNDPALAFQ